MLPLLASSSAFLCIHALDRGKFQLEVKRTQRLCRCISKWWSRFAKRPFSASSDLPIRLVPSSQDRVNNLRRTRRFDPAFKFGSERRLGKAYTYEKFIFAENGEVQRPGP